MNNHNCLEKVRNHILTTGILKDKKEKYVIFDIERQDKELLIKSVKITSQVFSAGYYFKDGRGRYQKKVFKSTINHKYCPFCGVSYDSILGSKGAINEK